MTTCGTCKFARMVKDDIRAIACFGAPPVPVLMPVKVMTPNGMGMDMQIQLMRPNLPREEPACSFHQPVLLVGANGDAAG